MASARCTSPGSDTRYAEYVDVRSVCVCLCVRVCAHVCVNVCVSSLKIAEHKAESVYPLH